ncbi:MAG: substrate-binding domain-containing protein [Burkholderiales bacterium]
MSATLAVLSAGAAKGLLTALAPRFRALHGTEVAGTFNAVGAIRQAFADGAPCDVLILTAAMLDDMAREGLVDGDSIVALGRVDTGVAVRRGEPHPPIAGRAALRALFDAARGLYCPDPERATAGIHFVKVLRALDLWPAAQPKLRAYNSGGIAMQAMADAAEPGLVGCTQVTEILYTPGVELVGVLPPPFDLATVYAAAVPARAAQPQLARDLIALLAGDAARAVREAGGLAATA